MGRFVLRRIAQSAVVLLGVTLVVFLLLQLVPGDPVRIALGTRYDQETYDALRERSGLDRPLPVQYLTTSATPSPATWGSASAAASR